MRIMIMLMFIYNNIVIDIYKMIIMLQKSIIIVN